MREIKIITTNGIKLIGHYDEVRNTFISSRKESKHLFKKLDAWGIDSIYLDHLCSLNGIIEIHESEKGQIYTTNAKKVKEEGKYLSFKGHRLQVFLPRKSWEVTNKNQILF